MALAWKDDQAIANGKSRWSKSVKHNFLVKNGTYICPAGKISERHKKPLEGLSFICLLQRAEIWIYYILLLDLIYKNTINYHRKR